jgi:hypothetical protein
MAVSTHLCPKFRARKGVDNHFLSDHGLMWCYHVMLVTKYLSHASGGMSPTWELRGKDASWFQKLLNEFDNMWELAVE